MAGSSDPSTTWRVRVPWPDDLATPVRVDPAGKEGPTPGRARGPGWRRCAPRHFVPTGTDSTRVEQRILEQAARLPEGGAVTGWAALRLAGGGYFDGLGRDGTSRHPVPLVVPRRHRARPDPGFCLIRRDLGRGEVRSDGPVPCVSPVAAVFDEVYRQGDLREAVVTLDMALVAALITFADLDTTIASGSGRPGVAMMRAARELATSRSLSPAETRMRLIWELDAGLPRPRCNWPVLDDSGMRIGRPDLLCDELGVFGEFDGAGHREREQHRTDVSREDAFRRTGLEGFGVVGADLWDVSLVVDRMRAAVRRAAEADRPRRWCLAVDPRPLWP